MKYGNFVALEGWAALGMEHEYDDDIEEQDEDDEDE
jgi:hypothetical protein